jgi:hypothetical protein
VRGHFLWWFVGAFDGESAAYTYNLRGRLSGAQITRPEVTGSVTIDAAFVYDHNGIRVRSESTVSDPAGTREENRYFLVDAANPTGYAQVLEETGALTGIPVMSYVIGDDVLAQSTGTAPRDLLYDGHGSTRLLTSSTQAITDRYDYDAYGVSLNFKDEASNRSSTDLLYAGEQFDPHLQQCDNRARYYDPGWISLGVLRSAYRGRQATQER